MLDVLAAGASQDLVKSLQIRFEEETGAQINATFGAVGAIQEALLAGQACDVIIASERVIDSLVESHNVLGDTGADLGFVHTGVAVPSGESHPDISTPRALSDCLTAADRIYCTDPIRSSAGIHFASVLKRLEIFELLEDRLHTSANGAIAMRELAGRESEVGKEVLVGCTQLTEILYTPGVEVVGPLPGEFDLATLYTARVCRNSDQRKLAARFIALLTDPASAAIREEAGFALQ